MSKANRVTRRNRLNAKFKQNEELMRLWRASCRNQIKALREGDEKRYDRHWAEMLELEGAVRKTGLMLGCFQLTSL